METTEIAPERSVQQIEDVLARYGAAAVLKEYAAGSIQALSFKIDVGQKQIPFRLPCRWEAIETMLKKRSGRTWFSDRDKDSYREKAKRVAWRQILRWVEAQMALVETGMVKTEEVFLPYIQQPDGRTVYEALAGSHFLMLPPGK